MVIQEATRTPQRVVFLLTLKASRIDEMLSSKRKLERSENIIEDAPNKLHFYYNK